MLALQDHLLIDATQRLGRHWKDIQREHFPGRSKNDIKNRYDALASARLLADLFEGTRF
jgi:hypothetical protein